jgi:hypothetical protein
MICQTCGSQLPNIVEKIVICTICHEENFFSIEDFYDKNKPFPTSSLGILNLSSKTSRPYYPLLTLCLIILFIVYCLKGPFQAIILFISLMILLPFSIYSQYIKKHYLTLGFLEIVLLVSYLLILNPTFELIDSFLAVPFLVVIVNFIDRKIKR